METINIKEPINLRVLKFEFDFSTLLADKPTLSKKKAQRISVPTIKCRKRSIVPPPPTISYAPKRDVKQLVEELLDELYADRRDCLNQSAVNCSRGSTSAASLTSSQSNYVEQTEAIERNYLEALDIQELRKQTEQWEHRLLHTGERLAKFVKLRDRLRRQQKRLCAAFTVLLRHINKQGFRLMGPTPLMTTYNNGFTALPTFNDSGENGARFGVTPVGDGEGPCEGGYAEWLHAMRLVARLPAGVPQHFRKKLWLTLAERHLTARGIDWSTAEGACFRGTAQPDDAELGAQIIKDLHRTGCSLFCGTEGRENQAMLRRVLLAYARWNKEVGYCQGFNMLAAIILEVMDKSESDSLKVMIYLVEAVLPEGYFADDLRGLSADMAAFRDLLRLRLPRLANHMDYLQKISDGGGVEPPLPDVFTMQWFLTLYATWLPRESLLRIWDLILLDGNEILLLTALAIWDLLQDRILSARSADEFYSCMGGGAGAVWEAGDALVARVVAFGSAPELPRLRSLHRYRVVPPAPPTAVPVFQPPLHSAVHSMTKRGLRLFYSEDEGDSSDDGNKMALATVIPRRENRLGAGDRLSLDIGALKRQYARLRERQRQAHVILAAACARHAAVGVPTSPTSLTVNNLLLGKSAIVSSRGRRLGPPPGAIPPLRSSSSNEKIEQRVHTTSHETICWKEEKRRKSLSRRNSVKWRDLKKEKGSEKGRKASIDLEELGDGVIVSEIEADEMIASLRSRSSSETSTYSSRSASSTDTSLCDENARATDSEPELSDDEKDKRNVGIRTNEFLGSPILKDTKIIDSPTSKETSVPPSPAIKRDIHKTSTSNSMKSISDYLDSAAGEPLRTYIDGFETQWKNNLAFNTENDKNKSSARLTRSLCLTPDKDDILQTLNRTKYDDNCDSTDLIRPTNFPKMPNKFTDLSPIDLSPCNYIKSPYDYDFISNIKRASISDVTTASRPVDIIDSFTMYPNFVPDIDLSEKNISDIESPPRSPGAESIIVSEDEPPIPLKIDKYFEHSPEFFGARVTDPNSSDIPNRRSMKRLSRLPKKPDSLTLHSSQNDKLLKEETERASSLPQSHSFMKKTKENIKIFEAFKTEVKTVKESENNVSPNDYILRTGRKNSERALQIIQENSKILSRILTKQSASDANKYECNKSTEDVLEKSRIALHSPIPEKPIENNLMDSPLLKESTSDSLIGYRKRNNKTDNTNSGDFVRVRPISIDDPFSLESRNLIFRNNDFRSTKSPSSESIGNKTDLYGWENKGFLANCEARHLSDRQSPEKSYDYNFSRKDNNVSKNSDIIDEFKVVTSSEWSRRSFSGDSKISVTLPSTEIKDTSTYERRYTSEDFNYPFSTKYDDLINSKVNDICGKVIAEETKNCEYLSKTENSQNSDFAHVTTSISYTYEPSAEDDSTGAKSNSSDTLCQITSLDQVSTPISPKTFPSRDTSIIPKDYIERSDKTKIDSDDTCSAITSLLETDTLSSLSYPRSPSTGSYHPFPTRPSMRLPKEIGVKLGMYPKDVLSSPPK